MKSFDNLIGPAARAAMRDDRRIRSVISRIVPAPALEHVTFCRIAERRLRVTLDGAAWIPKLRFSERALLAALIRDGLDVRAVSWHVTPAKSPAGRETAKRSALTASPRAARAVLSAATAFERGVDAPAPGIKGDAAAIDPDGSGDPGDDELARQLRRMARNLVGRPADAPSED